ncbi:MAG TPA: SURF1 family protein [Microvirga sp.]|jgi:surfeit locus 1 family protein
MDARSLATPPARWRALVAPGIAALMALAVLLGLGTWQLQRRDWKENLIAQIETRSKAEPGAILPPDSWATWEAERDEFRRVRLTGTFLHEHETPVHGLSPGQRGMPVQGFYLITPLRIEGGAVVMVNRGFVPTEGRDPATRPGSQPAGPATVTGLVRAPESRTWFTPEDSPRENRWFTRDPQAIAAAKGLEAAPFYVAAEAPLVPGGPRNAAAPTSIPNNHLQYAITWYGIALTLIGVFAAFAWRRLRAEG